MPGMRIIDPYRGINLKKTTVSVMGTSLSVRMLKKLVRFLSSYYERFPIFECIEIETINRCNGSCTFCPAGLKPDKRPFAKMDGSLFAKIIEELAAMKYKGRIALYSNNEPYLDERIIEFIAASKRACPQAFVFLYSNGSLLDPALLLRSFEAGLDQIFINQYGGGMTLKENLKNIFRQSKKPGFRDFFEKIYIFLRKDNELLSNRGGNAPNKDIIFYKDFLRYRDIGCTQPFRKMVVRSSGEVSLCCSDVYGEMMLGDVSRKPLLGIWKGEAFEAIRRNLKTTGRKGIPVCRRCDVMDLSRDFRIVMGDFFYKAVSPRRISY
ncbi:MAG: SPASM domain-containing protein [Candidatus Aminicenantes bacterium]|nr:SPASM domain-containing protein [Candidatus Aminicenantes bacterium]